MSTSEQIFQKILEEAKSDPNIIAFWIGGSRGKGVVTKYSDYDCVFVVKDEVLGEYKEKYKEIDKNIETWVKTLKQFKDHAEWGTEYAWDRYNFTYVEPLVDKTGEVKKLFAEKAVVPPEHIKSHVEGALDAYINNLYRSLKCNRDGLLLASHVEAAQSILQFIPAIFGVEGRISPYAKYLEWELKKYPLLHLLWPVDIFLNHLQTILSTGDIQTQLEVFKESEPIFRKLGYSNKYDSWEEKLEWIKNYK